MSLAICFGPTQRDIHMSTALDALVGAPPIEFGGSRNDNRSKYQKDWTFCLLLKLHVSNNDYLVVCDYHDDVLVLDSSTAPKSVDFYQIKTKQSGHWTLSDLIYQKPGKDGPLPSILSRLYRHRLKFGAITKNTAIESNVPFDLELISGLIPESTVSFSALQVKPAVQSRIISHLRKALTLTADPVLDASLVFSVNEMSHRGHSEYTRGRLSDFLEGRDSSRKYPIGALYRTISDQIGKCTSYEFPCTTVVDLLELKSISRAAFEKFIVDCLTVSDNNDPQKLAQEFESMLREDKIPILQSRSLRKNFERFVLERMDRSNVRLQQCIDCIKLFHRTRRDSLSNKIYLYLEQGLIYARSNGFTDADPGALMAALAWEVLTDEGAVPPVNPQPTEQTP